MNLARSRELLARAESVIPLGTQTLSKSPTQFVQGATPIYLDRGKGARVWDVDGNEFIDFPMALGPVLLGYRDERVDHAIRAQLEHGITFTLNHPVEVEVAEAVVALCPGVEAVRFGKSGSDAVSAAVRAARAITGRDLVLVAGSHGWHDWYIGSTTRDAGVPTAVRDLSRGFRFGDITALDEALDTHGERVAAVVVEPSGPTLPPAGYLQGLVQRCRDAGALSVFDEVIVGFRVAPGGARERYGVEPDLSCYGKAMGNGMPVSAVGGRWEVMRVFEEIFYSGTHAGEALSLAAAGAVLATIADGEVLAGIERLGRRMLDGTRDLIERHGIGDLVVAGGEPHRTVVDFRGANPLITRSWVQQCLAGDGVLFNGSMFISAAHTGDDIDHTLASFDRAFDPISRGVDLAGLLIGPPVQPVFRAP
ncbi:MAG: aminotransferase class III-fold pyridoxal phosphate-dependent enzyme [Acidimicrobiales bacterium]